ncbi:AMP-dependent synthetase [Bradyrhizobium sp. SSBR45G]|uniref:AMP-dependent synthetase/ligase n=1 Tax=unclassified Bradyrhizobium TaxID=2631580 RepID=UPI002342A6CB|nr:MULTISPECIES: AMP-dependent synthetase/ligase [unclassified Bradyrhizobium]GLH78626.1 AMP-dependent synthetase [Bradyrhizobium sp. SSBR45G]GLH89746.1 AMP-dependent synthetase [Bradyrhizobium sp. SSBR45R]
MLQPSPTDDHALAAGGLAAIATLPELWRWRVRQSPDHEAYRQADPQSGSWTSFSWRETDAIVDRWRRALAADAFDRGDRIAILMPNGLAHLAMDQAALSRGLVPVPMHAVDNADSIAYILADCGARLLLVDSDERWNEIAAVGQALPDLKRIVCAALRSRDSAASDPRLVAVDTWLEAAAAAAPRSNDITIAPHDLAAIVYTSGTTGRPKGVMLSHDNVISNVKAIHQRLAADTGDVFLSFLPLSHTFERTAGYYYPIAIGACVAYARSVKQLSDDLIAVRPTILVSVPRIYERIYSLVMHHRAVANVIERALLDLTVAIGGRRFDARHGHTTRSSVVDQIAWPLLQRLVADKVLARFGGKLRVAVSGGAPIAEPVVRLFLALGLEVLQGYGMTETSPVVSVNTPDDNDPRSVGRALPGIEVRIGDNDELMVRGPGVMLGYWHRPEETARIKESDGWLHTGDQARIDQGRITITGRIKDILVTSTGEKIAPADLETAILTDPLFEQAIVIGENRPFVAAIVVLNPTGWAEQQARLAAHGQRGTEAEAASLLRHIARTVKAYPAYATPKAVHWTLEPWTIQAGLITPTLKNKRPAIERAFAKEIEAIYAKRPA